MAVTSFIATRSAINVVLGACLGITVSVIFIESSEIMLKELYSLDKNLSWTDEIKKYIADHNWSEDDDINARRTASSVRLSCIVISDAEEFNKMYTVLQQTWTKRCDDVVYFSEVLPLLDNVVKINNVDNTNFLLSANVLFNSLDYIYQNHFTKADWFLKVVPKTYIIVENLKHFLSDKNADKPIYYGQKFVQDGVTFPSDDAGFVLSREALRILTSNRNLDPECQKDQNDGSIAIARCFKSLGVVFANSLDSANRSLFNSASTEDIATHVFDDSYLSLDINANSIILGTSSISPSAISLAPYDFNYLVALEYYFYHARKFGVVPQEFV